MGFIYVLQSGNTDKYKIGYSKHKTKKRLKQLQTGNPEKLNLIYEFETKFNFKTESTLHHYFKHYRIPDTEFFQLNKKQIKELPLIFEKIEESLYIITHKDELNEKKLKFL